MIRRGGASALLAAVIIILYAAYLMLPLWLVAALAYIVGAIIFMVVLFSINNRDRE